MFPIYDREGNGMSVDDFKDNMIDICKQHHRDNKALMFAFIMYDVESPQISKLLYDNDYRLALHKISGVHLTIFYILRCENESPSFVSCHHEMLHEIRTNNDSSRETDLLLSKHFNALAIKYPSLLFFQVEHEQIVDSLAIAIDAQKKEDTFIEIKNYIDCAVKALQGIAPKCKKNFGNIFKVVASDLRGLYRMNEAKKLFSVKVSVLGLFKLLFGLR